MDINHAERKHALLSASGSSRWLVCTPSPMFEERYPEDESSEYAQEGTLAHEFGELELLLRNKRVTKKAYNKKHKELKADPLYTDEMESEVAKYVDYVTDQYTEALRNNADAQLTIENKIDLSFYAPESFGTVDTEIISDGTLEVIDLKYGKGVEVSAIENSQLMLYGLGTLREYDLMFDIETVRLTIVQPRLNAVSTWNISRDDLMTWGEEVVKPKALMAYNGAGELVPGEHCRWCKARNHCPALAMMNNELAAQDFDEIVALTDEEIISIYEKLATFMRWAKDISEHVLKEAIKGKQWPGYKLVVGRSSRKWVDEEGAITKLRAEGYEDSDIINTKIKGIGDIEKLVKKKNFEPLLNPFVVKPLGAPTLAPVDDSRPTYSEATANDDFKN